MARAILFLALVSSLAVAQQRPQLQVNTNPEGAPSWTGPGVLDSLTLLQMRVADAAHGDWHCYAVGCYIDDPSLPEVPAWLNPPPPTWTFQYTGWNGPVRSVAVPASMFQFMLTMNLTDTISPGIDDMTRCVQDWSVPLRSTETVRVWDAFAELWTDTSGVYGNGYGALNHSLWRAMLRDATADSISSTDIFRVGAMARYAAIYQAILAGAGTAGANAFFDHPSWKAAIGSGRLKLVIQPIAFRSPDAAIGGAATDGGTDVLVNHPLPTVAGTDVGLPVTIPVALPHPSGAFIQLEGPVTPGTYAWFDAAAMTPDVIVKFETQSGPVLVGGESDATRTRLNRYKVLVPLDANHGSTVLVKTGLHPTWVPMGVLNVLQPPPGR